MGFGLIEKIKEKLNGDYYHPYKKKKAEDKEVPHSPEVPGVKSCMQMIIPFSLMGGTLFSIIRITEIGNGWGVTHNSIRGFFKLSAKALPFAFFTGATFPAAFVAGQCYAEALRGYKSWTDNLWGGAVAGFAIAVLTQKPTYGFGAFTVYSITTSIPYAFIPDGNPVTELKNSTHTLSAFHRAWQIKRLKEADQLPHIPVYTWRDVPQPPSFKPANNQSEVTVTTPQV